MTEAGRFAFSHASGGGRLKPSPPTTNDVNSLTVETGTSEARANPSSLRPIFITGVTDTAIVANSPAGVRDNDQPDTRPDGRQRWSQLTSIAPISSPSSEVFGDETRRNHDHLITTPVLVVATGYGVFAPC
jgi:hypothetical protein